MEFIHHARLMRHHKYICECVKSIGGNGFSWIKNANLLVSLVLEGGTSWACHCWFRFFQPSLVQIGSFQNSPEEKHDKASLSGFWVYPQRCNQTAESDPEFQEGKYMNISIFLLLTYFVYRVVADRNSVAHQCPCFINPCLLQNWFLFYRKRKGFLYIYIS